MELKSFNVAPKPHPPTTPYENSGKLQYAYYIDHIIHLKIGGGEKEVAAASDIPPPKPPRRTSSVTMKKPMNPSPETTADDAGHEYEVID